MAKKPETDAQKPSPLELLQQLDAATLEAGMAELKSQIDVLQRKWKELFTLRKALAFRTGEFKHGGGRKKKAVPEPERPPAQAAAPSPTVPTGVVERIRAVLAKHGKATVPDIAIHGAMAMDKVLPAMMANKDQLECLGAGTWRLRAR